MSDPAWRRSFLDSLPFPPDPFQHQAFESIDAGRSVLVSAPTGAGKTLVAEYAADRVVHRGAKAFVTTPLKALSNQKRLELAARYGDQKVGLLTGDTSWQPNAPVVVMTTEVLRNMLLNGSPLLSGLSLVVLDEVHYLQDPYRGGVWEEVIVLAPSGVTLVCLSATVANAEELGAWLTSVRGPTDVIVEHERPVTLEHHFSLRRRSETWPELQLLLAGGRMSAAARSVDDRVERSSATSDAVGRSSRSYRPGPSRSRSRSSRFPPGSPERSALPFRSARRTELIELLDEERLLPAIVFIFSRMACDDAVRQCLRDGLRLTTAAERAAVRQMAERHVEHISDAELEVLGYTEWVTGLEAGFAAHHAGLVPAFREAVEEAFAGGLLRVVYATETLALGINMPARTVVLERFSKWGPAGRATLGPGDYRQLTGRAGRRGLDAEGHAVVLWSPELRLTDVARVAAGDPPALRSSFRPTYNLAANLVARFDRAAALDVLRRSFGQWQAVHRSTGHPASRSTRRSADPPPTDPAPAGEPRPEDDHLVELLGRRLSVLEELGFVRGWTLTGEGWRLGRLYHEADVLVAQLIGDGVLDTEPSLLAGVLSSLVFEPRRSQRLARGGRPQDRGGRSDRGGVPAWHDGAGGGGGGGGSRRRRPPDRIGPRRQVELDDRLVRVAELVDATRAVEEVHRVPPVRRAEPALAPAVVAWARGAPLGEVLEVAATKGLELAPGDFVRTVKQLADLVGQVAMVAAAPVSGSAAGAGSSAGAGSAAGSAGSGRPVTADAAREAGPLLLRGVVAAPSGEVFRLSTTGSSPAS